jgi:hypothetical protein
MITKKKTYLGLLVFISLFMLMPTTLKAAAPTEYNVKINGQPVKFTMSPFMEIGNLLLPFREIFEVFGYDVEWNGTSKTATCKKGEKKVLINVSGGITEVNGKKTTLSVPACIVKGRIYVSSEVILQGLELNVSLVEKDKTIYFTSKTVRLFQWPAPII